MRCVRVLVLCRLGEDSTGRLACAVCAPMCSGHCVWDWLQVWAFCERICGCERHNRAFLCVGLWEMPSCGGGCERVCVKSNVLPGTVEQQQQPLQRMSAAFGDSNPGVKGKIRQALSIKRIVKCLRSTCAVSACDFPRCQKLHSIFLLMALVALRQQPLSSPRSQPSAAARKPQANA